MLSYLRLKNFKSFSNIMLNLRGKQGQPKRMAYIYGENGSGKSNLMLSLLFLSQTMDTLENQDKMNKINDKRLTEMLDKVKDPGVKSEILEHVMRNQFASLKTLLDDYRTIDAKESMEIEIGFTLEGEEGSYTLICDQEHVIFEELSFQIKKRRGVVFSFSDDSIALSPSVFKDAPYRSELQNSVEKYWGKHTFVSILMNEIGTKNSKYVKSRLNENLFKVLDWLKHYSVLCRYGDVERGIMAIPFDSLRRLDRGTIKREDDQELRAFEKALNEFFTKLYPDIKSVHYRLEAVDNMFRYSLYVRKRMNGKTIDIPFALESTGTKKLLDIFPYFFSAMVGSSVFVDEVDSGIHDLLMCEIVNAFSESLMEVKHGQFIATTHNTHLMKQLPRECVYIIRADAHGNKEIVSIDEYEFRTQKTHNVQSKYLRGDYSGVPFVGHLDFFDLVDELHDCLEDLKDGNEDSLEER